MWAYFTDFNSLCQTKSCSAPIATLDGVTAVTEKIKKAR